MKKLLFLIATTALLCGCDKITIDENDVADTYWREWSTYYEHIEDGKKVKIDTAKTSYEGFSNTLWHFKDNEELVGYITSNTPSRFYYSTPYQIDLKDKKIIANTYKGEAIVYKIRKFTDSELIVEYTTTYANYDHNGLVGLRFRKIGKPEDSYFSNFTTYEEWLNSIPNY